MRKLFIILVLCTLLFPLFSIANPSQLINARMGNESNATRIVFELTTSPSYRITTLTHPYRVVVDLENTDMQANLKKQNLSDKLLKNLRYSENPHDRLRIVLQVANPVSVTSFVLKANSHYKHRLVIDLAKKISEHSEQSKGTQKKITESVKIKTSEIKSIPYKARDVVVVIDPGHGGKDPGAHGPRGWNEKEVVLAISRNLQRQLNQIPGIYAVLTRKGDYYISLRDRLRIARNDKADLFIAIHADAYINHYASGASVYALSERGATSEAARWLAERENYSELGGVKDFKGKSYVVRSMLLDLSQTATTTQSLLIGNKLLSALASISRLHHNQVEQAGFVVLKSPDIPSLLVETGFISNPNEENRLTNPHYQNALAYAMTEGIRNYFLQNPLKGTYFEKREHLSSQFYVVKRGDTLAMLAKKFQVSVNTIKKTNHLSGNRISVGQRLQIK